MFPNFKYNHPMVSVKRGLVAIAGQSESSRKIPWIDDRSECGLAVEFIYYILFYDLTRFRLPLTSRVVPGSVGKQMDAR